MWVSVLRWLGVPFLMAAIGLVCVLISRWVVSSADNNCTDMVGGACVEGWHTDVVEWSIYLGLVAAILLMIVLCAWLAPTGKRIVAVVVGVLAIAPVLAGYVMTGWAELVPPVLVAVGSALIGNLFVWRARSAEAQALDEKGVRA